MKNKFGQQLRTQGKLYNKIKGIVRSFPQKFGKRLFCDCNLSGIKLYISVVIL